MNIRSTLFYILAVFFAGLGLGACSSAHADTYVQDSELGRMDVPSNYRVIVQPKGFNFRSYSKENPFGFAHRYGVWPLLEHVCSGRADIDPNTGLSRVPPPSENPLCDRPTYEPVGIPVPEEPGFGWGDYPYANQ